MELTDIAIAFFQGLLSSLSACVYPLIPITTTLFGAANVDKWYKGFFLSGVYVLGMSVTYVAIGLVAAFSGSVFGAYLGKPEVIFIFGLIFFYLGLGFMNILPLPIPNLGDKLHVEKSNSLLYPLLLGIFSGFIAAPCTAPLFGSLLIHIAENASSDQSILPGVIQAFSFSLGMGLPFLLIGGFALKLPKPGNWLNAVKYIGGTVLIAAGFHYMEDLLSSSFPPSDSRLFVALLIGVPVFFLFVYFARPMILAEKSIEKLKKAVLLSIAAFGLFLATSPFANVKSDQPDIVQSNSFHSKEDVSIVWHNSLKEGIEKAKKKQSYILIDFWATWCSACHLMEQELFPAKEFKTWAHKNQIVLIRLDFTEETEEKQKIAEKYQLKGLPTLVFAKSDGKMIESLIGYRNKKVTMEQLQYLANRKK